jgi:hypothetical protein
MKRLVLIHGRSQEEKDPDALKAEWLQALQQGLASQGLSLPLNESICFPYYGDSLTALCGVPEETAAPDVLLRGLGSNTEERRMFEQMMRTAAQQYGISDADALAVSGSNVSERGFQNIELVLGIARLLSCVEGISTRLIEQFTHDVHSYLTNPAIAKFINDGVRKAFEPDVDTLVVSHSLGTVVSHRVLNELDATHRISHLITLGSPLGIPVIQDLLAPLKRPSCVAKWFNARDPKDVVALFPLAKPHFPLADIIDNSRIENRTPNRHGISGYIGDLHVARVIYDALSVT